MISTSATFKVFIYGWLQGVQENHKNISNFMDVQASTFK